MYPTKPVSRLKDIRNILQNERGRGISSIYILLNHCIKGRRGTIEPLYVEGGGMVSGTGGMYHINY